MAPKSNVAYPAKAPRGTDQKHRHVAERWRKALPTCQDCGHVCFYLLHSDVWVCREHGQQWTGRALAFSRGYRPCP